MNTRDRPLVGAVVRALVILVLLTATATAIARPSRWTTAEGVVRQQLADRKADVIDVTAKKDQSLGTAFWVRTRVAGKPVGHLAVVRGKTVYDTPGDTTIAAILAADDFLDKHTISAGDLLYLLRELGPLPPKLGNAITRNPDARLNPKLTFAAGRATFVVHAPRDVRTPGAPTRARASFVRATLVISRASDKTYVLTWKLDDVTLPLKS